MSLPSGLAQNPFALLMHPEAVLEAIERSERLGELNSRVCRPLDKPLIAPRESEELAAFDAALDAALDPAPELPSLREN